MPTSSDRGAALVSGGSGAIGSSICRMLHANGWPVAIGYVSRERAEALASELDTPDVPAVAVALDMTDTASVTSGVETVLDRFGRVGAVVFNGGAATSAPFVETSEDDWQWELDVNLVGPLLTTRLCLPGMIEAGHGTFVGITSEAAKVGDAHHAAYSAAKAGLAAFFRTLVREHARDGIRANCVAPGPIDTPMLRYSFDTPEAAETAIGKLRSLVPLKRLGQPDEVAAAVAFLCSAGADYVAGQHLSVGGGVTMQ